MAYAPPPQYPQQPLPQGPKQRPTTVTTAVWIMYLTALVLVITAIAQFSVQGTVEDAVEDQLRNDPALADAGITIDDISSIVMIAFAIVAFVYLIFAAFYVVLGLLDNAGKRPARILTWILAGISLACCGFGGLIDQIGSTTYTINDQEYNDELTQALADATPAWVTALEWASLLLFIGGSLAVIILLALPASNEFFRKEVQPHGFYPGQPPYGWQPPNSGSSPYGQQPPPPNPGQQPYGQQPPGPEQPPPYGQEPQNLRPGAPDASGAAAAEPRLTVPPSTSGLDRRGPAEAGPSRVSSPNRRRSGATHRLAEAFYCDTGGFRGPTAVSTKPFKPLRQRRPEPQ